MKNRSSLRIGWLLVGDVNSASARMQGFNVIYFLNKQGIYNEIIRAPKNIDHHLNYSIKDYVKTIFGRFDIIVFQKVFDNAAIKLAGWLRLLGIKTVFILCDLYYTKMVEVVDFVVVTSEYLFNFVRGEFGVNSIVIDDAIEIQSISVTTKIPNYTSVAIWVGSADNWSTISDLILNVQSTLTAQNVDILTISNHVNAKIPWSQSNVLEACSSADFALIPSTDTAWAMAKSTNRLSMFLALGLPVIAYPIPAYVNLAKVTGGVRFAKNIDEWSAAIVDMSSYEYRNLLIGNSKKNVLSMLDMKVIGNKWLSLFKTVLL